MAKIDKQHLRRMCVKLTTARRHKCIAPCTRKEVDTRILLHLLDVVSCGHHKILIETNDTDVVALAVSNMRDIPAREKWVVFGVGKHLRYLAIHNIVRQLGPQRAKVLTMFHAIDGCDSFSFFAGKPKKSGIPERSVLLQQTYFWI